MLQLHTNSYHGRSVEALEISPNFDSLRTSTALACFCMDRFVAPGFHFFSFSYSTANMNHGSVLVFGNLKHASMGCFLSVDGSRDDNAQIII